MVIEDYIDFNYLGDPMVNQLELADLPPAHTNCLTRQEG